jgi:mannose-6-phosphate isomerase
MDLTEKGMKRQTEVGAKLEQPLLLHGFVQHYSWGKPGDCSLVAKYAGITGTNKPCAELWFGTHPKGPTTVVRDGEQQELRSILAESPHEILGATVRNRFGDTLPFLFKVLSINEALSIQAHPSKTANPHGASPEIPSEFRSNHAAYLHWKDPTNYPDANHKPEIAVALTTLSLLHGFKPVPELISLLKKTPELLALVGEDHLTRLESCGADAQQSHLVVRGLYQAIVQSTPEQRAHLMGTFMEKLSSGRTDFTWERAHLERMFSTYGPQDVGIATSLIMNWIKVAPGNAVYMGPNELHAYLEGDIIECMATSDNVVRAGLTPKFQDTVELLAMADVTPGETKVLVPRPLHGSTVASVYETPASEFQVMQLLGSEGEREDFSFASASLLLCVSGRLELNTKENALVLHEGQVALVPAASGAFSVTLQDGMGFLASTPTT